MGSKRFIFMSKCECATWISQDFWGSSAVAPGHNGKLSLNIYIYSPLHKSVNAWTVIFLNSMQNLWKLFQYSLLGCCFLTCFFNSVEYTVSLMLIPIHNAGFILKESQLTCSNLFSHNMERCIGWVGSGRRVYRGFRQILRPGMTWCTL